MIFASGFIEANDAGDADGIVSALDSRNIEVTETKDDRIVFLIERETSPEVKKALDSLKGIEGVRSVYLAYFSVDGADIEPGVPFPDA